MNFPLETLICTCMINKSFLFIIDIDHPVKFNLVVGSQRLHERRAKNQN